MRALSPNAGPTYREPTPAIKSGNQDVTSSTTLVDVTGLSVPIAASEKLIIVWKLHVTFAAAGALKVAVTTPAGATQLIIAEATPNAIVPAAGTTTASGTGIALAPALATAAMVTVTAAVTNGATAGNVTLQFAQNASDVTATSLKAGSYVTARRSL